MPISTETRAMVRATLAQRIDLLGRELSRLTPSRIAFAVDDIRREAQHCAFDAVARLASGLEREMAASAGTTVVLPYLEAMGDALDCDAIPPSQQTALLASVGVRLYG